MGVKRWAVEVNQRDRLQLEGWLRTQSTPRALAMRASIVLGSAAGESIRALAQRLKVTERTVCLWRRRYANQGLDGLRNQKRSGRPRRITSAKELAVVSATLRKPTAATHWSTRRLAKEVRLSRATVHRIWQKYGLQPHRVETFKFSSDPEFDSKLADSVGLYLDPPERALVLCVDEKSQIQALNRTQRALPMWPGLPARMTHDYTRHGTTSLFAALEVASGKRGPRTMLRAPYSPPVHCFP
jgi:transposase